MGAEGVDVLYSVVYILYKCQPLAVLLIFEENLLILFYIRYTLTIPCAKVFALYEGKYTTALRLVGHSF